MSDSEEKNISIITLDWLEFKSPEGSFTLKHPRDWAFRRNANCTEMVPPDMMGGVSIYVFHDKNLQDKICIELLKRNPTPYIPQTKVKIQEANNVKEFSLQYCNSITKVYWKNKVIRTAKLSLLISAGAHMNELHRYASIFDEMIKSVKVQIPAE
jgi:hypothetical protein